MKCCDYLQDIFLDASLPDKEAVLRFIADACVQKGVAKNAAQIYEGLENREKTMSTGVGEGLAFPHTVSLEAKDAAVFLIGLAEPIDFEALDDQPVDTIMALVVPENKTTLHLRLLARISRLCKNPVFIQTIRQADNAEKLLAEIRKFEDEMTFS
ncbi:PTS sugar transporter subunit IIA [candidate division CSSED10-310 bacterium]|uniref:PTS sugar transporter subunit IIA n=1 Tax=candidate division CSSED10-310 bacterium TaxID=2855610 RepID=A0ABV6Z216_UNCC1